MAKIISFQKVKQAIQIRKDTERRLQDTEDDISSVLNDYSLTPAHRRWKLENMLMNVDEQLEQYKKELEAAERRLNAVVAAAENDIARTYGEFGARVRGMTRAVQKLTGAPARQEQGRAEPAGAE